MNSINNMNRNIVRNNRNSRKYQIRRPIQKYIPNHHQVQDPPVSIVVARLRQKFQGKIFNRFNTIYNDYQYILNIYPELN